MLPLIIWFLQHVIVFWQPESAVKNCINQAIMTLTFISTCSTWILHIQDEPRFSHAEPRFSQRENKILAEMSPRMVVEVPFSPAYCSQNLDHLTGLFLISLAAGLLMGRSLHGSLGCKQTKLELLWVEQGRRQRPDTQEGLRREPSSGSQVQSPSSACGTWSLGRGVLQLTLMWFLSSD